jgi:hypothetical protein
MIDVAVAPPTVNTPLWSLLSPNPEPVTVILVPAFTSIGHTLAIAGCDDVGDVAQGEVASDAGVQPDCGTVASEAKASNTKRGALASMTFLPYRAYQLSRVTLGEKKYPP